MSGALTSLRRRECGPTLPSKSERGEATRAEDVRESERGPPGPTRRGWSPPRASTPAWSFWGAAKVRVSLALPPSVCPDSAPITVSTGVGGLNGRRDTMSLPLAFRYLSRSHSSWMVAPGTGNPARASADAVVCVPRTKRKGVLVALPQLVSSTWRRWDVPPHRSAARCRAANTDAVVAVAGVPPAAILRQERHRGGTRS